MRICDVNNFYSPTGGGIRIYHRRKLEHFSKSPEHSISLIIPGKRENHTRRGNTVEYSVRSLPLGNSGYRLILESGGLSSVFGDFKPDIVEIGTPYFLPSLVRTALGGADIPTVGFVHANYPESYVTPFARRYFPPTMAKSIIGLAWRHAGRIYGEMTAVFAASRYMLGKLRDTGLKRLFHTPLGVDTDLFHPSKRSTEFRRKMGVSGSRKLILYLSRLQGEKGIDLLLESYPLFRDPRSLVLAIGGSGPAESRVGRFMKRYPEVIRLPHLTDRNHVAQAMASADIFLSLGTHETFGLAGLEAIASGTIPVFPDSGSSGEMAASLGILPPFQSGDHSSLAESILSAVELSGSSTDSLREFAEVEYSWNSVFQRIEDFYRMVISAFKDDNLTGLQTSKGWWEQ